MLNKKHNPFFCLWEEHSSTTCPEKYSISSGFYLRNTITFQGTCQSVIAIWSSRNQSVSQEIEACQRHADLNDRAQSFGTRQGKYYKVWKGRLELSYSCCSLGREIIYQFRSKLWRGTDLREQMLLILESNFENLMKTIGILVVT